LLYFVALVEFHSNNPIARSILDTYKNNESKKEVDLKIVAYYKKIPGYGII